ncbi:odorant receptor 4-like [Copidosoma floridanum]|uniref:odorant receptor 4-like n=1 Tax=Copidosoma floridanum TaxID=29053 RepID=UPI000C6F5E6E|nr:odorant receptor 4-like [Copidosoma floridanum]
MGVQVYTNGFRHAFGICQMNLKIVGLWPNLNDSKAKDIISLLRLIITFFTIITFVTMAQTTKLLMIWGDLNSMIDTLSTASLPITVTVLKTILFINHKREIAALLLSVFKDWSAYKSEKEVRNMFTNAQTTRKISYICMCLGIGSVNGYVAIRMSQEMDVLPGQINKREPMLISYFPYDYKPSPIYEITWLLQYAGAILATFIYSGIHCLFVGLVLHLRGQVKNLRLSMKVLEFDDKNQHETRFKQEIGFIVERHEHLNSANNKTYYKVFFTLISADKKNMYLPLLQIIFMMIYVMHIGTHIFIFCFVAEKLQDESLLIRESAYNFQWYEMSPENSKLLLLIIQRSQKPLVVTAGKFCSFSLHLFAQIIKTSGGYLSMLLAIKDRM